MRVETVAWQPVTWEATIAGRAAVVYRTVDKIDGEWCDAWKVVIGNGLGTRSEAHGPFPSMPAAMQVAEALADPTPMPPDVDVNGAERLLRAARDLGVSPA